MEGICNTSTLCGETIQKYEEESFFHKTVETSAFAYLDSLGRSILKTYSNINRGSGQHSLLTTALFEKARESVLEYLNLDTKIYTAIFCTSRELKLLLATCKCQSCRILTSKDIGLALGISVLAIKKNELPKSIPFQTGGDVIKLVSPNSVVWAPAPYRFEAGTPSIVNGILFASSLLYLKKKRMTAFLPDSSTQFSVDKLFEDDPNRIIKSKDLLNTLRDQFIGLESTVPTDSGQARYINLDNAASTPTFEPVFRVYIHTLQENAKNQKKIITKSKQILSSFFDAPLEKYSVMYSRNTTEAVNIVTRTIQNEFDSEETVIINTILEHHSNELPWRYIPGINHLRLEVDNFGFINISELELLLQEYNELKKHGSKRIRLITISGASNVLGTIQDIHTLSTLAHKYGARILIDAAQLAAHRKISMMESDIDYLVFSGHKMYAPFGSGALVAKTDALFFSLNEYHDIISSGEENAAGIAALGKAIDLISKIGFDIIQAEERHLHRLILKGLAEIPGITVFGIKNTNSTLLDSKGGVITFSIDTVPHNKAAQELAEIGGIGVRTGCFCAHLITKKLMKIHPIRSFLADIGSIIFPKFTGSVLPGIIRASIGIENTEEDVSHFLECMRLISTKKRSTLDRFLASTYNATPFVQLTDTGKIIQHYVAKKTSEVFPIFK